MFLSEQTDWIREATPRERTALTAAFGGYAVDAFDYMIYTFIIPTLIVAWGMSNAEAGVIATVIGCRGMGGGRTGRPLWASENTTSYNNLVHRVHLSQRLYQLLPAIAVHAYDAGHWIRWRVVGGLRVDRRDDPT